MTKKMRLAAALSAVLTLGAVAGPIGSVPALADECSIPGLDVPSLRIELTPAARAVRRGQNAWIVARVTRIDQRRPHLAVPVQYADVFLSLSIGKGTAFDAGTTNRRGYVTLIPHIPARAPLGTVDAFSTAENEVEQAGCVHVREKGSIEIPDLLRIKA